MGPFGASHYSLSFFVPFYAKLPPSDDGVPPPEAASLADAWKGLGLTYILLKGLKKTSKTLKLIKDSTEVYTREISGTGGRSGTDKVMCRSLTVQNPVAIQPVSSQNTVSYGVRKLSRGAGQVSSHTTACKSDTLGVYRGDRKSTLADSHDDCVGCSSFMPTTMSRGEIFSSTENSLQSFGLGLEGVMTTITGLSQQGHLNKEMKGIITVVKTADRVVEGVKAAKGVIQTFSSPFGDALIGLGVGNGVVLGVNTVKIVLKGVKISKGLVTVTKLCKNKQTGAIGAGAEAAIKSNQNVLGQRFKVIVKGLKASEGAANVVAISKEVGRTIGMLDKADFVPWIFMVKGLKFTKSAIRVLEPLGSIHWGVVSAVGKGIAEIKGAVEGIGMVVKAAALSKELFVVLLKGVSVTKGAMAAFNEFNRRSLLSKQPPISEGPAGIDIGLTDGEFSQITRVRFVDKFQQLETHITVRAKSRKKNKFFIKEWEHMMQSLGTNEANLFARGTQISPKYSCKSLSPALCPFPLLSLVSCLSTDFRIESCFSLYSMGQYSEPQQFSHFRNSEIGN